jgi:hypothetical protein
MVACCSAFCWRTTYHLARATISRIQAAGKDVTDSAVMISPGTPSIEMQVTISPDGATVEGVVVDDKQLPCAHVTVVAIPDGKRRRNEVFQRRTTTDQYGIFHLRGLAPGAYRLISFEDNDRVQDLKDDDTYDAFESRGTSIQVTEKENKRASVRLIGIEEED